MRDICTRSEKSGTTRVKLHAMKSRTLHAALKGLEQLAQTSTHFVFILLWDTSGWFNQLDRYDKAAKQIRREDRQGR